MRGKRYQILAKIQQIVANFANWCFKTDNVDLV